ncbi:MAG: hypothetical protein ACI9YB_000449 [Halioglobus sp.]|jgi:hypothetical protein
MRTDCYEYQSGGLDGMDGLDVTEQVNHFRSYLKSGWPCVDSLMDCHDWENDGDLIDDWIQVSWELLVERELLPEGQYLTPLAPASCCGDRVTKKNMKPTFMIATEFSEETLDLRRKKKIPVDVPLRVFGFLSQGSQEGYFQLCPNFDVVELVKDKGKRMKMEDIFYVPVSNLKFSLRKWSLSELKN